MRADGELREDAARHREDIAAFLEAEVGGDQRATPGTRLDDDDGVGEAGHDAVAGRKTPGDRTRAWRILGNDQAVLHKVTVESAIAPRVNDVHAAAEHGD